ncbi:uncharacterized protein DUF2867 [Litoreibacter ponti]|uniref:Uncharacterized protein DUF2867 n=1 Tax=Litoreibacter ponti TaxID=1510457 RepID=A0A2T6BDH7_9RHOB|nr:DUF2867 domain-containing protein [Litoreibacter ponti]PTX54109.1 uncharacterized protein DUF2867 [Litoreibacter ponti]
MLSPDVRTTALPAHSKLHAYNRSGDFLDCYGVPSPLDARTAAEIITEFPSWVGKLLVVRGLLTSPFGLDNDGPDAADKLGPFPVEHSDAGEVIAGFNDRHLDFRVSVMAHQGQITLATWVHTHNIGGKAYLAAIMPFHILIARNALTRVAQAQTPMAA